VSGSKKLPNIFLFTVFGACNGRLFYYNQGMTNATITNDNAGTIKAEHAKDIIDVFGEKGQEIADQLAADPSATMLGLLFADFAKG